MAEPIRFVQVGAGQMGRAWLETIKASDDARLVGLVDLDETLAARAVAELGLAGVSVGSDLAEVLTSTSPDAVIDVAVPRAHLPVNTQALGLRIPVLSEKPLSESLAECLRMVAAAEVNDTLLMVSQSRRYWRNLDAVRALLRELGRVELAVCDFFKAPHFPGFREEMAHPLLIDMAIHQFDIARELIAGRPLSVWCVSSNPSWSWFRGDAASTAVFDFDSGARFTFTGSWVSPGHETSWNGEWRLSTQAATVIWDGDNPPHAEGEDGRVLPVTVGEGPEQIAGSLAEFIAALRSGERHPTGEVHDNVWSVAMVIAAVRSADTGERVSIREVLSQAVAEAVQSEPDQRIRARVESVLDRI